MWVVHPFAMESENYASMKLMASVVRIFLLASLAGCVTMQDHERRDSFEYGCRDLVVIGRIMTVGSEPIEEPADPESLTISNWRSKYQLQIHIKRVIRGIEPSKIVPANVVSHSQIRDDRDFLIVLSPNAAGGYSLEAANLWEFRPALREPCLQALIAQ